MQPSVDVIILCLNEAALVKESVRRLKKEPWNIIVVDNGSDDEEKAVLRALEGIHLVDRPTLSSSSVGRNAGLAVSTGDFILLLDGDILYIPGSVDGLLGIYQSLLPAVGCVGIHNPHRYDGTQIREEADVRWPENTGKPYKDFDMAWTQYGLFEGEMLREIQFHDEGIFGQPGVGYEDDWLWHEMQWAGRDSYYVPNVLYYHEKHGGRRYLESKGLPINDTERGAIFRATWDKPWHEKPLHQDFFADLTSE